MLPAPPVETAVENLGAVVGTVVLLPEVEVVVEFPVAEIKTPPATADREIVLAFTAAAL